MGLACGGVLVSNSATICEYMGLFSEKFTFGLRCASVFHSTLKHVDYDVDCTLNAGFHRNNLKLRHAVCCCFDNTLLPYLVL